MISKRVSKEKESTLTVDYSGAWPEILMFNEHLVVFPYGHGSTGDYKVQRYNVITDHGTYYRVRLQ